MGKGARSAGLILYLLAASGGVFHAGADPLKPPDLEEYLRWGPLRVRPGLSLSDFGYDNNVFYNPASPVSDFTMTLTPGVEGLVLLGSRGFVTFDEAVHFRLYRRFNELNALDHSGRLRLTVPLGDIGFTLESERVRLHERPLDLEDSRAIRRSGKLGFGVILKLGWRTSLKLDREETGFRYTDEDFGTAGRTIGAVLDRRETDYRATARYRLLSRTDLTLETTRKSLEFDFPVLDGNPDTFRNQEQTTILPGIDFGLGGVLSGQIRLGRTRLDYRDPALEDYSGTVGRAALSWRLAGGARINLDAERTVGISVWQSDRHLLNSSGGIAVVRYLNRYLGLEGGYRRGRLTIPHPDGSLPRRDRFNSAFLGLRFRVMENELGRRIEYAVRVTDWNKVSSLPGFNLARRTVSVSADFGF